MGQKEKEALPKMVVPNGEDWCTKRRELGANDGRQNIVGMMRFNTDSNIFEGYTGVGDWGILGRARNAAGTTEIDVEKNFGEDVIRFITQSTQRMAIFNGGNSGFGEISDSTSVVGNISGYEGPLDLLLELSKKQKVDIKKLLHYSFYPKCKSLLFLETLKKLFS